MLPLNQHQSFYQNDILVFLFIFMHIIFVEFYLKLLGPKIIKLKLETRLKSQFYDLGPSSTLTLHKYQRNHYLFNTIIQIILGELLVDLHKGQHHWH
jgi:hypothetical protein